MKKLLFSAVLVSLFLFGCSQDVGINEPAQQIGAKKSLIKLPADFQMLTEDQLTVSGKIDGSVGGFIEDSKELKGRGMRGKEMYASLIVPAGAFEGTKVFNIVFDNNDAAVQFTPSPMDFNKPLTLNFSIGGMDLKGVDEHSIDFVYITPQGDFEKVDYESIHVDKRQGTLTVVNAQLNHFSRYGFID